MSIEEIIRNLKYEQKKHENDRVGTFQTNISAMCKDCADCVEELKSRAEKAEARAEAAINEIRDIDKLSGKCIRCKSWNGVRCKRGYSVNASFCNDWQWRGVQDNPDATDINVLTKKEESDGK